MKISLKLLKKLIPAWHSPIHFQKERLKEYKGTSDENGFIQQNLLYDMLKSGKSVEISSVLKTWSDNNLGISENDFYQTVEDVCKGHGDYLINAAEEYDIEPQKKYVYELYDERINTKSALEERVDELLDSYNPNIKYATFHRINSNIKKYCAEDENCEYEITHPLTGLVIECEDKEKFQLQKENLLLELKEIRKKEINKAIFQLVVDKNNTKLKFWIKYHV
jgi:hypothetical protein